MPAMDAKRLGRLLRCGAGVSLVAVAVKLCALWLRIRRIRRVLADVPYARYKRSTLLGFLKDMLANRHRIHDWRQEITRGLPVSKLYGLPFDPTGNMVIVRDPLLVRHFLKDDRRRHHPSGGVGSTGRPRREGRHAEALFQLHHGQHHADIFRRAGGHDGRRCELLRVGLRYRAQVHGGPRDCVHSAQQVGFGLALAGRHCWGALQEDLRRQESSVQGLPEGLQGARLRVRASGPDVPRGPEAVGADRLAGVVRQVRGPGEVLGATGFSTTFLRDVVLNFIIAGRDTTACALTWMFYILATHPVVQEALCKEIDGKFPRGCLAPTLKQLSASEMPYLNGVLYETLRLYPPVPVDFKYCARDDVLPDGSAVPAGVLLSFFPYGMGRDASTYEDPLEVKPERWIPFTEPLPHEFPVFQAGPRICLGKDMAIFEAKLVSCMLLQEYTFELAAGEAEKIMYNDTVTMSLCNSKLQDSHNLWLIPKRRL